MDKLKAYYYLTKPGIIYGNAIYATAGFLLASRHSINFALYAAMMGGTSLVIGSACVINNFIDRDIDKFMERTKKRSLATRAISNEAALTFGVILGAIGFSVLIGFTNRLTVATGVTGMFFYLVAYSWSKRHSVHGTLIGAVSGAMPPLAGYLAVTNHFDGAALALFVILVCWQMPHFYAIAVRRLDDYRRAKIPVLPVVQGVQQTKIQITAYIMAFVVASLSLTALSYTGYSYAIVMFIVGAWWFKLSVDGFSAKDNTAWAKKVFLFSLVITLVFSVMVSFGARLP